MQVRVDAIDREHPRVRLVAEDIRGEQRRGDQDDHVQRHDRGYRGSRRDQARVLRGHHVGREHQRECGHRLARGEVEADEPERPRERGIARSIDRLQALRQQGVGMGRRDG